MVWFFGVAQIILSMSLIVSPFFLHSTLISLVAASISTPERGLYILRI